MRVTERALNKRKESETEIGKREKVGFKTRAKARERCGYSTDDK